jgi:hypothetical protein
LLSFGSLNVPYTSPFAAANKLPPSDPIRVKLESVGVTYAETAVPSKNGYTLLPGFRPLPVNLINLDLINGIIFDEIMRGPVEYVD